MRDLQECKQHSKKDLRKKNFKEEKTLTRKAKNKNSRSSNSHISSSPLNPIKLEKNDISFVLPCIIIIFLASFLLYREQGKGLSGSNLGPKVGMVIMKKNQALRKFSNQIFWEKISNQLPIYNMDTIRTGNKSDALVVLEDGTELDVGENTIIIIDYSKEQGNLQVGEGSVQLKQAKGSKKLSLSSGEKEITVEGGELQLTVDKNNKQLELNVSQGTANLLDGGKEEQIQKNEKLRIQKGNTSVTKQKLILLAPQDRKRIVTSQNTTKIVFRWEATKLPVVYLEISKSPNFASKIVRKKIVQAKQSSLSLGQGTYYWRVSSFSKKKKELSNRFKFTIHGFKRSLLLNPSPNQIFTYVKEAPLINFSWSRNQLASGYSIEIAQKPSFQKIYKSRQVSNITYSSFQLPVGTYYWRIITRFRTGKQSDPPAAQRFQVIQVGADTLRPILGYPKKGTKVSQKFLKTHGIQFTWQTKPEVVKSILEIASDPDFTDIVFQKDDIQRKTYPFLEDIPVGRYYWRIKGVETKTPYSTVASFNISLRDQLISLNPIYPPFRANILPKIAKQSKGIGLAWERPEQISNYYFEVLIAKDRKLKKVLEKQKVTEPQYYLPALSPGRYYWKVWMKSNEKDELLGNTFTTQFNVREVEIYKLQNGKTVKGTSVGIKRGKILIETSAGIIKVSFDQVISVSFPPPSKK